MLKTRQFLLVLLPIALACSCQVAPKEEDASKFNSDTAELVESLSSKNPKLAQLFDSAAGYAVFPVVGEGGLLIASGWGRGAVYEDGDLIGYASTSEHSIAHPYASPQAF